MLCMHLISAPVLKMPIQVHKYVVSTCCVPRLHMAGIAGEAGLIKDIPGTCSPLCKRITLLRSAGILLWELQSVEANIGDNGEKEWV